MIRVSLLSLLSLLLAVALMGAGDNPVPDHARAELVQVVPFATLTEAGARQLQGRPARFLVELASEPSAAGGQVLFECAGQGGAERSVWFSPDDAENLDDGDLVEVEAVLVVIRHRAWQNVPSWVELRLTRARLVR